jgi:hypothetical protein
MNQTLSLTSTRRVPITPTRRRQLLTEFERSGLSAAEFARQQGIGYSTLCAWRARNAAKPGLCFAEVELERAPSSESIVVELGRHAQMRLSSTQQLEMAARLLKQIEAVC